MSQRVRVWLVWGLAMLAAGLVVWNSRFSADVSFFLPARPTAEQQVLVDQLKNGSVSRLLMLSIDGGSAVQRAQASRELRQRLLAQGRFISVQNGAGDSLDAEREVLLRHRYLLSPAVDAERFGVDGLRSAVADTVGVLASPIGLLIKPYITRDPTGELVALLEGLNPASQPALAEGVWTSGDGQRAVLLVQTQAQGSDIDGQQAAIEAVRTAFDGVLASVPLAGLRLDLSGPGVFAVQSRETIQAEVARLSLISSTAILLLMWVVYRSARLMVLGWLPVMSGALAGVAAVGLVHDTVFGVTVGFGSALIGEAVDYAIYFFVQSGRLGLAAWRQRFWPTVRLGVLTTVCGFGALLFSGFPGLAQLGLYATVGVVTAALVTLYVLPTLVGSQPQTPDPGRVGEALMWALRQARGLRWPLVAVAVAASAYLWWQRGDLWHPNLSALSTVSQADGLRDSRLRTDLGAPDARYLVVIHAPDRQAALVAAERAGQQLDPLVAAGQIGGYDSPTRFLPSDATQQARRDSLPPPEVLGPRLQTALADSPLSPGRLQPFLDEVEAARRGALVQPEDLRGTALALAVDALLSQNPRGWTVLMPLRPVAGEAGHDIPAEVVRAALQGTPALFIDMKNEFNALYGGYIREALWLSLAGLVAIVALLVFSLRRGRALVRVLVPVVFSVAIVVAGLRALGQPLHLLHLIGMLLIVAIGSNYALFFVEAVGDAQLETPTVTAMVAASLTTVIGFGTLATSSVPVLQAVGMTVAPGALLALVLSAAWVNTEARP